MKRFCTATWLGLLAIVIFACSAQAQYVPKLEIAAATGAYIQLLYESGVQDKITERYPDLSARVDAARNAFQARFGVATDAIAKELSDHAPDVAASAAEAAQGMLQKRDPVPDRASAEKALHDFEEYAKGNVDPPALKATLLSWQYRENPIGEMTDGFTNHLTVVVKAPDKAFRVSILHPMSWKLATSRDQTAVSLRNDGGVGIAAADILPQNFPKQGGKLTTDDVKKVVPGAKNITMRDAELAGLPATIVTTDGTAKMGDEEAALRYVFYFVHPGAADWVSVSYTVFLPATRAGEMDREWVRYKPVFDAMTKTIQITSATN